MNLDRFQGTGHSTNLLFTGLARILRDGRGLRILLGLVLLRRVAKSPVTKKPLTLVSRALLVVWEPTAFGGKVECDDGAV